MYNRYIPNGTSYTRVTEEDGPQPAPGADRSAPPQASPPPTPAAEKKKTGLAGLLKGLKLEGLDTGDLLLLLILLFLFLEGDDMELVITLGLLLVLGLGDGPEGASGPAD